MTTREDLIRSLCTEAGAWGDGRPATDGKDAEVDRLREQIRLKMSGPRRPREGGGVIQDLLSEMRALRAANETLRRERDDARAEAERMRLVYEAAMARHNWLTMDKKGLLFLPGTGFAFEGALSDACRAELAANRHVCGLQGYDPMRDPPCPECGRLGDEDP